MLCEQIGYKPNHDSDVDSHSDTHPVSQIGPANTSCMARIMAVCAQYLPPVGVERWEGGGGVFGVSSWFETGRVSKQA